MLARALGKVVSQAMSAAIFGHHERLVLVHSHFALQEAGSWDSFAMPRGYADGKTLKRTSNSMNNTLNDSGNRQTSQSSMRCLPIFLEHLKSSVNP